ncbi:MAG TPA: autotransporter-associated beta strand repeat-containing protein [Chthoniobacterales bacterium]|nr:autotransporter-associated beta strand repeat-containing protein [Chthoniobacterales bacterium]
MPVSIPSSRFAGFKWLGASLLLLLFAGAGYASYWINPSVGDWFISTNWDEGVPSQDTYAVVNNGGTILISAPNAAAGYLWVGYYDSVAVLENKVGNGTLLVSKANSGAIGTLHAEHISIPRTNFYTSPSAVTGTLNISGGGFVQSTSPDGWIAIGDGSAGGGHGVGSVNVSGAASSLTCFYGPLSLGVGDATGTLVVENGGYVRSLVGDIGAGSVTIRGSGSSWYSPERIHVGTAGPDKASTLDVLSGGRVTTAALRLLNGFVRVDNGSSATSGVDLGGGGTLTGGATNGSFAVGDNTAGKMVIFKDGALQAFRGFIGFSANGVGSVVVYGKWKAKGSIWVGDSGSGTLEVLSGGNVSGDGNGYLAFANNSAGLATVSGTGSSWTMANNLYIGGNSAGPGGSGELRIFDGGTVGAGTITLWNTGILSLGSNATLNGPLTVEGGAIETSDNVTFAKGFTIGAGGVFVRTNGFNPTFSGVISGLGGLSKIGSFTGSGLGTLTLTGANTYTGPTTVSFGKLVVNGSITSAVTVNGNATLGGTGIVNGITIKSGGVLAPGNSAGKLTVQGNYTQENGGILNMELGGTTPGTGFDQVAVGGSASISGTLNLNLVNGFRPVVGQTFAILTSSSATGNFSTINSSGFTVRSDVTNAGVVLTITSVDPGIADAPSLANISTRLRVETDDNVLIGGFIVTGTQAKKVIVRAIGPSLPFADKLANPILELHGPGGLIAANDNWVDSPNKQAIIDSTVPPGNDLESAIVATLPANNSAYTAVVRGQSNTTGIGVVEVYDLDRSVDSKLANISTRGLVQTGDNILIAGTIVLGQGAQKVIVRAIGPSLPIDGKLADPTLELRNADGDLIRANDNWRAGGQEAEIIASTVPPTHDLESAIVESLPANGASYTAIVRGLDGTTGIAVVEVYALGN